MKKSVNEIDVVELFRRGVDIDRLIHRVTVECGITSKEVRDAVQKKLNDGVCSNCALNETCGKIEELIDMCDVN